jgi:AmmeMemoRadiSam system protein B
MNLKNLLFISFILLALFCTKRDKDQGEGIKVRTRLDTVGYAHTAKQMDSLILRIDRLYQRERQNIFFVQNIDPKMNWKIVICPHDDYSYAGDIYPYVLKNLSTPLIVIFGVAHKARQFRIKDQIVFDSFKEWEGTYQYIPISPLREEILNELPTEYYQINDSLHSVEHSVEALLPFLEYYHRDIEILPILISAMNFSRMEEISLALANAFTKIIKKHQLEWGKDFSFAISNDCVHYGDQDWQVSFAPFGADTAGYRAATNFDMNIISECLIDQLDPQRIRRFFEYTVKKDDYKEYAWTWCGRYSVPFGLIFSYHLQKNTSSSQLSGKMMRYSTSIAHSPVPVSDLDMGVTAPANIQHWVGYVAIGYD